MPGSATAVYPPSGGRPDTPAIDECGGEHAPRTVAQHRLVGGDLLALRAGQKQLTAAEL
jgi:hypothetical protein